MYHVREVFINGDGSIGQARWDIAATKRPPVDFSSFQNENNTVAKIIESVADILSFAGNVPLQKSISGDCGHNSAGNAACKS